MVHQLHTQVTRKKTPSKDLMHGQNVIQVKDSTDFIVENPNITPVIALISDTLMLSIGQLYMVPSHLPSSITIFETNHTIR